MSSIIKRSIASCFYGFKWVMGIKKRPFIITYHSIDSSKSLLSVSPAHFESQMNYLKQLGYTTVSLKEYKDILGKNNDDSNEEAVCVITFDDGFKSVFENAYPILKKFAFTATVFLPTDYIGKVCTWEKKNNIPIMDIMTWDEIMTMNSDGFDFQPHTLTHPYLTKLSAKEQEHEIEKSKEIIENKLGKENLFFCYPYSDYNETTIAIVKKSGFEGAVTVDFGRNSYQSDKYRMKRLGSARFAESMSLFKAYISDTNENINSFRNIKKKLL